MRIGSIVKYVKLDNWTNYDFVKTPELNKIYIVRGTHTSECGKINSIYLEEIINKHLNGFNVEPSFHIKCFVELLPPEECSLSEVNKILKENTYEFE